MLVESSTYCFWINLHPFSQRILSATANRSVATLRRVEFWNLLASNLGGRIHRCTCLTDNHIANLPALTCLSLKLTNQSSDHLFRLARSRPVANGNYTYAMFGQQLAQGLLCLLSLVQVQRIRLNKLACFINDSKFTAGTIARINTQNFLTPQRRFEQEAGQVGSKNSKRVFFTPTRQLFEHFTVPCRGEEERITILHSITKIYGAKRKRFYRI